PQAFGKQIRDRAITALFITTALFDQLAREAPSTFASLRHVLFGGEAVDPRWAREVLESAPPERLLHVYGPTECTSFATWQRVVAVAPEAVTIPIGRPLANTRLYVLDRELRPVPIGVPGELCLGGDGLARGYHARPALSAEQLVPDAVSALVGERLYRTGDLVRLRNDGAVEFLGRLDDQVKIRGFRIEPGELGVVLAQHPAVREAVAVVRADLPGSGAREQRMVGYVVAEPGAVIDVAELLAFVKGKLPDYMVPGALVELPELPLTPNGKVDRRALPAPSDDRPELGEAFVAPRNPVEEMLAGIWGEILDLERVGVYDNFFELGGHSLLATQLLSRIRKTFQAELPLRRLFEAPRVADLARELAVGSRQDQGPPLVPVPRDGDLPLSFAQQRLWFLEQLEPGNTAYNVPGAVRLSGPLEVGRLEWIFNQVVRRHEVLRTSFATETGRALQVIAQELHQPLPVVELRRLAAGEREAELRRLIRQEQLLPFDLATGPLIRFTLLRLRAQEHAALVTMHHIVSDGWSIWVFIRELAALYEASSPRESAPGVAAPGPRLGLPRRGTNEALPENPIQYADFAHWQREMLASGVAQAELAYWKKQLAGAPQRLELPTDRPRPAMQTFRGSTRPVVLAAELSRSLAALSRRQGVTLYMVLLAAFKVLLSRYSGEEDVVVGSPIAGRNCQEIEGLIGFFVNTLVLRSDLSGDPSLEQLLSGVRRVALDAYAHQNLPFEQLVDELHPQRDLSRNPLFQVVFALQNAPASELKLPGIRLSPLDIQVETAKFDLTLNLQESAAGITGFPRRGTIGGFLEYNTDLFDRATISRMAGHLVTLLAGLVSAPSLPDCPLSQLTLLTRAEAQQLLSEWTDTGSPPAGPQEAIHQRFEAQV
ncbi:MAG: AMP-binding protein, partial [bacterium]|nr:AMP-binding protein [bacterium]